MEQVVKGLTALGFAPIPSEANFVYFDVGRDGRRGIRGPAAAGRHRSSYRGAHGSGDHRPGRRKSGNSLAALKRVFQAG